MNDSVFATIMLAMCAAFGIYKIISKIKNHHARKDDDRSKKKVSNRKIKVKQYCKY